MSDSDENTIIIPIITIGILIGFVSGVISALIRIVGYIGKYNIDPIVIYLDIITWIGITLLFIIMVPMLFAFIYYRYFFDPSTPPFKYNKP